MKKFLCLLFCALGCFFALFWIVTYILLNYEEKVPKFISTIMLSNVIIIVLSLIIGFCVIRISVAQWFPNDSSDIMSTKDKCLVAIVVLITFICSGIFVFTIVNNNVNSIRVNESDNVLLRILMFIMANTFMAFAYWQHFQVVRFIE